jgi:hypothetical protein
VPRKSVLPILLVLTALWLGWAGWSWFTGRASYTLMVMDETGAPLVDVAVARGDEVIATTGPDGTVALDGRHEGDLLVLAAAGYNPVKVTVPDPSAEMVEAMLEPTVLRARVVDHEGRPVEGARVSAGDRWAVTGLDGRAMVQHAESGRVVVERPAWSGSEHVWDGGPGELTASVEPLVVRAVHVAVDVARDPALWEGFVRMAEETELNGIMLDLKAEEGIVYYDSQVELARRIDAVDPLFNLAEIARQLGELDLYLIGRIVAFQDPVAARRAPELAVWSAREDAPYQRNNQYFLDPTDPAARGYALDLAEEVCRLGVDEVQFDYVRFPDGYPEWAVFDGDIAPGSEYQDARVAALKGFLQDARDRLHPLGCAVAGDVFGFVTTATDDGGIGQEWVEMTKALDVVSPMLYPSHYASGWWGFADPNDHPREVVRYALRDGLDRLESGTVIRPWLQDFGYTPAQVRAQIDATEEFGFGWMLWNAKSNVSVEALRPGR